MKCQQNLVLQRRIFCRITGCVAFPFVDVHPQTIAATLAVSSVPEAVTQAVVVILSAAAGSPRKRPPFRHRTFPPLFRPTRPAAGSHSRFPTMQMAWVAACSTVAQATPVVSLVFGRCIRGQASASTIPGARCDAAAQCFKAGETDRAVADAMGVNASSVWKALERGRQPGSPSHLRRMAEAHDANRRTRKRLLLDLSAALARYETDLHPDGRWPA